MQTERNRKEYQGIGAIEAFVYENARSDVVAITEKNEKQYVSLLSFSGTQWAFSSVFMVLLITQQFNVMFNCRSENTSHCRWFQKNDKHDIYTNDFDMILMLNLYNVPCFWNQFCVCSLYFLKNWSI